MVARQIVVLGVHRSGTSLLTETGVRLGLFPGDPEDLDAGDRWNEKGYWENRRVRALDEELLAVAGTDWFCTSGFDPARLPESEAARLAANARSIVASLDGHSPWIVKDPRMCTLLPFWLPFLPSSAFLFSLRGPLSVARSLRARDGFPLPFGAALWEVHLHAALAATKGRPRMAVWYEDLVASPATELERLATWLHEVAGLPPVAPEVAIATDPRLRHHVTDHAEEARRLPEGARRLLDALKSGEAFEQAFDATPSEDALETVAFVEQEARTRRFLDSGWRKQRAAHEESIEALEDTIRVKDEYIADLRRHLGIPDD